MTGNLIKSAGRRGRMRVVAGCKTDEEPATRDARDRYATSELMKRATQHGASRGQSGARERKLISQSYFSSRYHEGVPAMPFTAVSSGANVSHVRCLSILNRGQSLY